MTAERESLEGLEEKLTKVERATAKVVDLKQSLGTSHSTIKSLSLTDIDPASDEYAQRFDRVVDINKKVVEHTLPKLEEVGTSLRSAWVRRIDEDLALVQRRLEEAEQRQAEGIISPLILGPLRSKVKSLQSEQGRHRYISFKNSLVQGPVTLEPAKSVEPAVPVEPSEEEKQIEAIRQNLGNPDAFSFPAGMTTRELFDQDTEEGGKAFGALSNTLYRADIISVEELLGRSEKDLVGNPNVRRSGVRGFGITNLEKTLNQLLKHGILPASRGEPKDLVPTELEIQPKTPLVIDNINGTITIGEGLPIYIGKNGLLLINYIYNPEHSNEEITAKKLYQILKDAGSNAVVESIVNATISHTEDKLGREIFGRTFRGTGKGSRYAIFTALKEFEAAFINASEPEEEKPAQQTAREKREEMVKKPVPESRLLALSVFLTDQNIDIEEIIKVLGPGRGNRPLTGWNAVRALANAVIFLKSRINRNIAENQEKAVWDQFRVVMDQDPRDEVKRFVDLARHWYQEQKADKVNIPQEAVDDEDLEQAAKEVDSEEINLNPVKQKSPKVLARQALITDRVRDIISALGSKDSYKKEEIDTGILRARIKAATGEIISDEQIAKISGSGYGKKIMINDHHTGGYSLRDAVSVVYISRFGNNLSRKQRRELFDIIKSEYKAWGTPEA